MPILGFDFCEVYHIGKLMLSSWADRSLISLTLIFHTINFKSSFTIKIAQQIPYPCTVNNLNDIIFHR